MLPALLLLFGLLATMDASPTATNNPTTAVNPNTAAKPTTAAASATTSPSFDALDCSQEGGFCDWLQVHQVDDVGRVPDLELWRWILGLRIQKSVGSNLFKSFLACQACKLIAKMVETKLQEKVSEEEVRAGLNVMCQVMPPFLRGLCTSLVVAHSTDLVHLVNTATPNVCQVVRLCSK